MQTQSRGDGFWKGCLEEATGSAFRFIIGKTGDASKMVALRKEVEEYDDFLMLYIIEEYSKLPYKTLAFFKAAYELYDSKFYVKADDDVYLRPENRIHSTANMGNHPKIFTLAGLLVKTYRCYDPATRGLDFKGLLEDLGNASSGAIILLHACAHNPTDVASRVESQLKLVIRPMYSNPPLHGASIVATILKDSNLFNEWTVELKGMAWIITMRKQLLEALQAKGTPGYWSHIVKQIGMFTFTGFSVEQVTFMTKEYHIYMTSNGRISMAGLSSKTVPHLANMCSIFYSRGFIL